jgi:hypothetical protein
MQVSGGVSYEMAMSVRKALKAIADGAEVG